MSTTNVSSSTGSGNIAMQLAVLEMDAEQADYRSDCLVRDAARDAKRAHDAAQVQEMRDKADGLETEALVAGTLGVASGIAEIASAGAQYTANDDKVTNAGKDERGNQVINLTSKSNAAEAYAGGLKGVSTALGAGSKAAELAFGAVTQRHDAGAAAQAHEAEAAKWRADDANEAAHRTQAQLDQKLAIIEQMLQNDAEVRTLIVRS